MTNRRCAGILTVLALILSIVPSAVRAADPVPKLKVSATAKKAAVPAVDLSRDLANKLVRPSSDGMEFKPFSLAGERKIDYFLVFYGAHWNPNCTKFTPKLTRFYREQRTAHRNFEVIFVSADKDENAMLQYMNGYKMPWPAVKFADSKSIASVKALAGRGYPCVALVDAKGKLIAHSYGEDRKGAYVGPLKPVEKLKEILDETKPRTTTKTVARAGR